MHSLFLTNNPKHFAEHRMKVQRRLPVPMQARVVPPPHEPVTMSTLGYIKEPL